MVALSFSKRLVQPIQDRVHPGFEYWGCQDPIRGQNRKVPRDEASNLVARMMQGAIRDKGCPKAHCLKGLTRAVSVPCFSELFCFCFHVVLFRFPCAAHPLGCNQLRISPLLQAKVLEYWSPAPLPEGDVGKKAIVPADLKEPKAADLEVSSNSSVGVESDVEVIGPSVPPHLSASGQRRRQAIRKASASKAGLRGALPKGACAAASRLGSKEPGAEGALELSSGAAGASVARVEGEAALGLTRMGSIGSPLLVARSQLSTAPLKLTFNAQCGVSRS